MKLQTSLILNTWTIGCQEDAERGGGKGGEQFKNIMCSFGASPKGNRRFKAGRRTTHSKIGYL